MASRKGGGRFLDKYKKRKGDMYENDMKKNDKIKNRNEEYKFKHK